MYIDYQHVSKEQVENNCYSNLPYITNSLRISVACLCHLQLQFNFPDVYQGHGGICAETNPTIVVCPALRPSLRHCERESIDLLLANWNHSPDKACLSLHCQNRVANQTDCYGNSRNWDGITTYSLHSISPSVTEEVPPGLTRGFKRYIISSQV